MARTEQSLVQRPSLLVLELWGLGDLVLATPFLQAATRKYVVTLVAKPYAAELAPHFWPEVRVVPFIAPWTAFRHKYRLHQWPWRNLRGLRRISPKRFDVGLSARWDPRDHLLLMLLRVRRRLGFPRLGSKSLLTEPLARPDPTAHRYEYWRLLGHAMGFDLPTREKLQPLRPSNGTEIVIHTGAAQSVRVWPLEKCRTLVGHLRQEGYQVHVLCDPPQREWWLAAGEGSVATPHTVSELLAKLDQAGLFIGNDSGPSHLAGLYGVPTFTLFGPQLPEWFAPLHPAGQWLEGKPCPYKPCSDYCRFPEAHCLVDITEEEVFARVLTLAGRMLGQRKAPSA